LALAVLIISPLAAQEARPAAEPKPAILPKASSPAPKTKIPPAPPANGAPKKVPPANYNVGETAAPVPGKLAATAPAKGKAKPPAKGRVRARTQKLPMSQRLDINSASREDLKKLPGISDAEVDKILAHRPYKGKEDLFIVAGLTGAQYFAIKDRVKAAPASGK
jgi:hypothetical protein